MPYLQVDLDGKRKWPMVAAGCEISEAQVCKGLLDLWESCWREKTSTVSLLYLECLFGTPGRGERTAEVLCAFGFLETMGSANSWRVRGAERYLRISAAQSAGGKAASGNLKRGKSPGSSRGAAGRQPESGPGSGPGLTPNTEHHSPNSKEDLAGSADAPPRVARKSKAPEQERPPDPRHHPLKLRMLAIFKGLRGADYAFKGRDAKALTGLLAMGSDEEILGRWRHGLTGQFKERIDSIPDLETKWNTLAGYGAPAPPRFEPLPPPRFSLPPQELVEMPEVPF